MNDYLSALSTWESAVALELGNSIGNAAVGGVEGALTGNWNDLISAASGIPVQGTQTPFNALGNLLKNSGVFAIGFLMFVGGCLWFANSWGDDLASAAQQIADRLPVPVE